MNPIAEEIIEAFDEYDVHYRVQEAETGTHILAEVLVDYTAFTVIIMAENESGEVSMRVPYYVRHLKKDGSCVHSEVHENERQVPFLQIYRESVGGFGHAGI